MYSILDSSSLVLSMHIFIDEAGNFKLDSKSGVPVVGAVVLPTYGLNAIRRQYERLRPNLAKNEKGEVKGSKNDEQQVASVVRLLYDYGALFEVSVIDTANSDLQGVQGVWQQLVETIRAAVVEPTPEALAHRARVAKELEKASPQLYLQSVANIDLLEKVLEFSVVYFSQRVPRELSSIHWLIDSKDKEQVPNNWEKWWTDFILPFLHYQSANKPRMRLRVGDYSYFKRFEIDPTDIPGQVEELARQHKVPVADLRKKLAPLTNLTLAMSENLRFSSDAEWGLELVDVVTNAFRRALIGNLKEDGWRGIPKLMIHRPHQYPTMNIFPADAKASKYKDPESLTYGKALARFTSGGRPMMTKASLRKLSRGFDYFTERAVFDERIARRIV